MTHRTAHLELLLTGPASGLIIRVRDRAGHSN